MIPLYQVRSCDATLTPSPSNLQQVSGLSQTRFISCVGTAPHQDMPSAKINALVEADDALIYDREWDEDAC